MALITEQEAKQALAPYHSVLAEAIYTGWDEWAERVLPIVPLFRPRTQADIIHDVAERELRSRLGANPAVILSDLTRDRFWLQLRSPALLVRVKKFDENFRVRNYPTPTASRFNGQAALPGLPACSRLTLGYRLTVTNDQLVGVYVALLKGDELQWKYELTRGPGGLVSIVPDYPSLPLEPAAVKLKSGAKRSTEKK